MSTRTRDVLYREDAVERAERIFEVSYALDVEFEQGQDAYSGHTRLSFRLLETTAPLFLDFTGSVTSMSINGVVVEPDHRVHRLWLAPDLLRTRNSVSIEYRNAFDATGDGFHHFVDPEDGLEYVYTNLEPFSAHRLFPCFDQPDIKATYQLGVNAPADWRVISAETAGAPTPLEDGRRRHEFKRTPRFSTYLFSLVAGPYERVGTIHDGIPLGLHGRRSMRRELERAADELFELTAQGLDYYRELFGQPFPFSKYDQVFVPEFNAGAMENVGAVTFNDSFIFRDPPTYGQRLLRGEVVLHELAHMWFGDLVTMRWWDDLWLNET
ncbi:MAG: M1 family metallopeptidase, partial [Chloroflexota bacterium]